jgi:hypothetical protein
MQKGATVCLVLAAACGTLSVAGCGASDSESEAVAGAVAEVRSRLPEGFPADVPVYPGLSELDVTRLGKGFEISGFAPDSIDEIDSYYTVSLDRAGWKRDAQLSDSSSTDARVLHYTKDDRGITVVVGRESDGVAIETSYKAEPLY